jgi:Mg-chelatase subunit ChlD
VFPDESPLNNRKRANDVIVLITDGKPQGTRTVVEDAIANAEKLKKKGILIIGVGVGWYVENNEFWDILKKIASPGQAIRVKFDKFQSIKNTLVKQSCQKYRKYK